MPRVPVQAFNNLFGMMANQDVTIKRSNKLEGDSNNFQVINKWNDPYNIVLRGRATFEENLLVAGKLAHPQLRRYNEVINAANSAIRSKPNLPEHVRGTSFVDAIRSSIGSFEFARGAMVSAEHYSNDAIKDVSFKALVKEVNNPETSESYGTDWIKAMQANLVARLLGQPASLVEGSVNVSGVTPLSSEDVEDENLRETFGRFVRELVEVLAAQDYRSPVEPEDTEFEGRTDKPKTTVEVEEPEEPSEKPEDPESDSSDESESSDDEPEEDEEDEGDEDGKVEGAGSKTAESGSEGGKDPISSEAQDWIDEAVDKAVSDAEETLAESKPEEDSGLDLSSNKVPSEYEEEKLETTLARGANIHKIPASSVAWYQAPDMSDLAPPEDVGELNRKSSGLLTSDAWKISLGNTKVFEASDEGEPQNLLVLADISGSTSDKVKKNKYGLRTVSEVIWALSAQLLRVTPNSKSYGFASYYRNTDVQILEGQQAGMVPARAGSGGTPTIQALRWAVEQANQESVICLITDDEAEAGSGLYVRQLADQGHRIATVLVPSPKYFSYHNVQAKLANYGSDMACIYEVTNEASNKALQDMFSNLLV